MLSDAEKRKQYDAFGANGARAGAGPQGFNFDFGDLGDLGDIFGGLFGRGRPHQSRDRGMRGADVEATVNLSFDDSLKGVSVQVPVELDVACSQCNGSGARPGNGAEDLPRVQRPRCARRGPGLLRAQPAVPALPWQRHRDRRSVSAVPRDRARAAHEALHGEDPGWREGRDAHPAEGEGRSRRRRCARRRPVRRHPRGRVADLYEARQRPARRGAGLLPGRRARHDGRGADAGRGGLAEGARRLGGRQAAPHPRPRRAEALRRRQGRRAGATEDRGAEAAEQEAARAARGAAERPAGDGRPPALHDQRRRRHRRHAPANAAAVRAEGARPAAAHGREHAPLLGGGHRAPATDPAADERARAQPRRRRARDPARGRAAEGAHADREAAAAAARRGAERSQAVPARARSLRELAAGRRQEQWTSTS